MATSHTFIGIPINKKLQEEAKKLQETFQLSTYFKKIVNNYDFHVTLLFLGGWNPEKKVLLWEGLKKTLANKEEFTLDFSKIETFGSSNKPSVFHISPNYSDHLFEIQSLIHKEAIQLGFERVKRRYSPHVTLAKKWKDSGRSLPCEWNFPLEIELIKNSVEKVSLYEVYPSKEPMYKVLSSITLQKGIQ
ncbi:RNA 2',3'-cyclic phosphodiesterase [Salipaludibacillus neizhouensis]|uniref:RNA 2',3'-cyclic phosphodiesterase n=1 Tax=Salipaludibacillus neizhouensis TaxID=885475 RepID=A0A3A9KB33_9BACI|nr:RNA 2',3'-cyclic phosphodiesterase [Salipaludibacillus neizhouensis]RKL66783.1 RNA 2',3'-cyclic phosphodiesterase [Salipaludibacillus neizhouensis]